MQRRVILNFCLHIRKFRSSVINVRFSVNKFSFKITWPVNYAGSRLRSIAPSKIFLVRGKVSTGFRIFQMHEIRNDFRDSAEEIDRSSLWFDRSYRCLIRPLTKAREPNQRKPTIRLRSRFQTVANESRFSIFDARASIRKDPIAISTSVAQSNSPRVKVI